VRRAGPGPALGCIGSFGRCVYNNVKGRVLIERQADCRCLLPELSHTPAARLDLCAVLGARRRERAALDQLESWGGGGHFPRPGELHDCELRSNGTPRKGGGLGEGIHGSSP
jgi:hypothetical protein